MSDILKFDSSANSCVEPEEQVLEDGEALLKSAEEMIADVHADIEKTASYTLPIAELATLGAGVSSLIPAFNTVTTTFSIGTDGLYRVINEADGALKANKTGEFFWGAVKTKEGKSEMAKLVKAGSVEGSSKAVAAMNPALMLIAVALFSINKKLDEISATQKKILSFLETEKSSQIEGDVKTLGSVIADYKHNWDNEHYIASNHKLVIDIQRTAQSNMISYQMKVADAVSDRKLIVSQNQVKTAKETLVKNFKYYRLSMYNFAMATLLEIMLGGNFSEAYISEKIGGLEQLTVEYRAIFERCSVYLEKLSHVAIEQNILKGVGKASDAVGKFIGKIPLVEKGPVDEFLQESGEKIQNSASDIENDAIVQFAKVSNPGIRVFIEKMEDLIQIYNHTADIYFDSKQIYLVAG